jgi:hypothetical protein
VALTPDEWRRAKALFEVAIQHDPGARDAFLDEACAGDPQLRAEIASLVAAHERAGSFIEAPAYESAAHLLADDIVESSLEGHVVGPYLVRHEIGRGGMGIVYAADDTRLSRRVALKALPAGAASEPSRRDRLRQEARAAAALSHPGIAAIYALEEIEGELYLACEYVSGQTLRTTIDAGALPLPEVIDIACQLAHALAAAHAHGVIHRDLKPENVMRTSAGIVKILDFGVARLEHSLPVRLTQANTILGTPGYMAPEQVRGREADFRSDLFALGLIVYEMASGSNPFEADTAAATIARLLETEAPPLSGDTTARMLDRIVSNCLRKNPSDRYSSTVALTSDLDALRNTLAAHHGRRDGPSPAIAGESRHSRMTTPRKWWEIHQLVVASLYVTIMYPAWIVRSWLPSPAGMLFLFAVLACAVVGTSMRLHLWFTERYYPPELPAQRGRAEPWTRACDAAFAGLLVVGALAIGSSHASIATLLMTVALAVAVASFMIEPATTRAAFPS